MKPSTRSRFSLLLFFIVRPLALYPTLGIALGVTLAMLPMWFMPNQLSDAFGGDVWRNQQELELAYVGVVCMATSAVCGLLIGLAVALSHVMVAVFLFITGERRENS